MRLAILILTFFLMCSCAQHGNRFDTSKVYELQPEVSTRQDAIDKLGQPSSISTYSNGNQLLQWQYIYGTAIGIGGGAHVAILFDSNEKMIRITHIWKQ